MKSFKEFLLEDKIDSVIEYLKNNNIKPGNNIEEFLTNPENFKEAPQMVRNEINHLKNKGVSPKILNRVKETFKNDAEQKNDNTPSDEKELYNKAVEAKKLADNDFEGNSSKIANIENEIASKTKNDKVKQAAEKAADEAENVYQQYSLKTKALKENLRKRLGYVITENKAVDDVVEAFEKKFDFESDDPGEVIIKKLKTLIDIYKDIDQNDFKEAGYVEACSRAIGKAAEIDNNKTQLSLDEFKKIFSDPNVKGKKPNVLAYILFATYIKTLDPSIFKSDSEELSNSKIEAALKMSNSPGTNSKEYENIKVALETINAKLANSKIKTFDNKLLSEFKKLDNFNAVIDFVKDWIKKSNEVEKPNDESISNDDANKNDVDKNDADTKDEASKSDNLTDPTGPSGGPSDSTSSSNSHSNEVVRGWDVSMPNPEDWEKNDNEMSNWFDDVKDAFYKKCQDVMDKMNTKADAQDKELKAKNAQTDKDTANWNSNNNNDLNMSIATEALNRASFYNKTLTEANIFQKLGNAVRQGARNVYRAGKTVIGDVNDAGQRLVTNTANRASSSFSRFKHNTGTAIKNRFTTKDNNSSASLRNKAEMLGGEDGDAKYIYNDLYNKYAPKIERCMRIATSLDSGYSRASRAKLEFSSYIRQFLVDLDRKLGDLKEKYTKGSFFGEMHKLAKENRAENREAKYNSDRQIKKRAKNDLKIKNYARIFERVMDTNFTNDADIIGKLTLASRIYNSSYKNIKTGLFYKAGQKYFDTNNNDFNGNNLNYSNKKESSSVGDFIRSYSNGVPMELTNSEEVLEYIRDNSKLPENVINQIKNYGAKYTEFKQLADSAVVGQPLNSTLVQALSLRDETGVAARQALASIRAVVNNGILVKTDKTRETTLAQDASAAGKVIGGAVKKVVQTPLSALANAGKKSNSVNNTAEAGNDTNNATETSVVTTTNTDSTYPTKPSDKDYKKAMKQKITYKKGNYKYEKWF